MKNRGLLFLIFIVTAIFWRGTVAAEFGCKEKNIVPRVLPKRAINVPMLEITCWSGEKDFWITDIYVERQGLSSFTDIDSVRAVVPYLRNRRTSLRSDDSARIRFWQPLRILANFSQKITVVANLDLKGRGRTVGITLKSIVGYREK